MIEQIFVVDDRTLEKIHDRCQNLIFRYTNPHIAYLSHRFLHIPFLGVFEGLESGV